MVDFLIIVILLAIVAGAGAYVYKAKKSGKKCIGCPDGASCGGQSGTGCSGSCGSCSGACSCGKSE